MVTRVDLPLARANKRLEFGGACKLLLKRVMTMLATCIIIATALVNLAPSSLLSASSRS